jgi:glutaredoxin
LRLTISSTVLLAILLVPLALVGLWAGYSWWMMPAPGSLPFGKDVAHVNRLVGDWLLARSFPQPKCGGRAEGGFVYRDEQEKRVDGIFAWVDESGEKHYVDDQAEIPERFQKTAKVDSLPVVAVYHGEFSPLRKSAAGVRPRVAARPISARGSVKAVVYTAEWCSACKATKAFLRGQGVIVEERDIDKDPRALAELVGLAGENPSIPVTMIGKKVIGGFDEAALKKALQDEIARGP